MASSLRLLRRSFRPAALHNFITPLRRLPHHYSQNITQTRPFSSSPNPIFAFDESVLKTQKERLAGIPSMCFSMMTANMPGLGLEKSGERMCVSLHMPGVKKEDTNIIISEDNHLLVNCDTHDGQQVYMGGLKLPDNIDRKRGFSRDWEDNGTFKLTLPLVKRTNILTNNFMNTFFDTTRCTTFYCAMMDRSIQEGDKRVAMADLKVKMKSFTLYEKETIESIYIKGSMPGLEKMEVTSEAVCVSLNMPGFEIEDVECHFVEYNYLMIEGKRKSEHCIEHYMAGIRTPEGFHGGDDMIKKEMEDGMYKVTLPHVEVISDEAKNMTGSLFLECVALAMEYPSMNEAVEKLVKIAGKQGRQAALTDVKDLFIEGFTDVASLDALIAEGFEADLEAQFERASDEFDNLPFPKIKVVGRALRDADPVARLKEIFDKSSQASSSDAGASGSGPPPPTNPVTTMPGPDSGAHGADQ